MSSINFGPAQQSSDNPVPALWSTSSGIGLRKPNGATQGISEFYSYQFNCSRTVLMGDSITARNGTALDPWTLGVSNQIQSYSMDGYFTYLNAMLGWPFSVIRNTGIAGNNTNQMVARFQTDVLNYSPTCVAIMGGVNDYNGALSKEQTVANITSMVQQCTTLGICVILWTITPVNGTAGNPLPVANRIYNAYVNQKIKQLQAPNVIVIDTDQYTSDFTNTTGISGFGGWKSGYASDGTHPSTLTAIYNMALAGVTPVTSITSPIAARCMASHFITSAKDTLDGAGLPAVGTFAEGQNLLYSYQSFGNNMTGTNSAGSGTITGNPPLTTTLQLLNGTGLTVTVTNPARADGIGNNVQFSCVAASGSAWALDYFTQPGAQFTVGKYYEFSGEFTIVSGQSLVGTYFAYIKAAGGATNNYCRAIDSGANVAGTPSPVAQTLRYRTPRFLYSGGETMQIGFYMTMLGTGTAVVQHGLQACREFSTFI